MSAAGKRLASFKALLSHARERLGLDLGFRLWDGSTVPADLSPDALTVVLADEAAVAALIRKPKIDTLGNLWVSGRLDVLNGSLFDLVAVRPKIRTRQFVKTLDKPLILRLALRFLFVPRGGPWPLEASPAERSSDGSERTNKANIQHHYDVSNDFYALFLDPERVYSCGYFTTWENDLATAQQDKLEMICRKLRLAAGDRFLDIGCGWGALVCHAARHHGARAHGITLSQAQLDYAREKVAKLGLQDRVTLELRDYSTLDGQFDKIASIGMFEHVGIDNHPTYFQTIQRLLAPEGFYLHHAITRPAKGDDKAFRKKRPEYAAIIRYIFPGAELDHIGRTSANLEQYGFEVHDVEGWREHYARTCRLWHDRLLANRAAAERAVGEAKTRLWLIYLAGCSIGFERGTLGIFQTLASKRKRGSSGLPPTRADLYR
ncbi:MAG: class I SAM-dependent methyltransferase [Pseudolabrys sp.]